MRYLCAMVVLLPLTSWAAGVADIHKCLHPGGTVELRDRPCPPGTRPAGGIDAAGGAGSFSTIPESRPPAGLLERARESMKRVERSSGRAPAEPDESAMRCAEYEKRVDAIDRRLRKGYTASEGTRLRAERRRIRRLLADACR